MHHVLPFKNSTERKKLKKIHRLDGALSEYEDMLWLMRLITETQGADIQHIPEPYALRQALEMRDFQSSMDICRDLMDAGAGYKFAFDCASDLADWCKYSKRIFSLSNDLSDMLLATELPDFPLGITKFVAQSYVVHIQKPVKTSNGREHDFIICSFCPKTGALSIRSYPKTYDDYSPITAKEKSEEEENASRGNRHFKKYVAGKIKDCEKRFVVGYTCFLTKDGSLKENILTSAPDDERDDWILIYKLALGVNLYLQSARAKGDQEKVTEVRTQQKPRMLRPVTEGAKLFELSASKAFVTHSSHSPTDPEHPGEVSPHFRRGYWRRPKGMGDDPEAPSTIWVRPTWVRMDKILNGEQPIGSFQETNSVE